MYINKDEEETIIKKADIPIFRVSKSITGQKVEGEKGAMTFVEIKKGGVSPYHNHESEQFNYVVKGKYKMRVEDREHIIYPGDIILIPSFIDHNMKALEDSVHIEFFSPPLSQEPPSE